METSDTAFDTEIFGVMHSNLLRGELFKTISILGLSGPSVVFFETTALNLSFELLALRVDASRRGVEEAGAVGDTGSFKDVETDHGVVVHDDRVIGLNEAHATHISGEIEDLIASSNHLGAVVVDTEIYKMEFIAKDVFLQRC